MKHIILTTILLCTSVTNARAAPLEIKLTGKYDFQAGSRPGKDYYNSNTPYISNINKNLAFNSKAKFALSLTGKTAQDLQYGGVIAVQTNTTKDVGYSGDNMDRSYIFASKENLGKIELGTNYDAASTMLVDATTIARATGGINGDFVFYYTLPDITSTQSPYLGFYLPVSPQSPSTTGEESRKITYYSPEFKGLQFGLSYIPDTTNNGINSSLKTSQATYTNEAKNAFLWGVSYQNSFDPIKLSLSLTGKHGKAAIQGLSQPVSNLANYAIGTNITYKAFTLAASYGNRGKSFNINGAPKHHSQYYTLGGAYVNGDLGTSLTYFESEDQKNKLKIASLSTDYQLFPGLLPYAEITTINTQDINKVKKNGMVYILGTQVKF